MSCGIVMSAIKFVNLADRQKSNSLHSLMTTGITFIIKFGGSQKKTVEKVAF